MTITIADALKAIADDKSLVLFNTIALSKEDSNILIRNLLGITKKQYYSRLSTLLRAGLVKRNRGKYSLTRFGGILYNAQEIIGKAVNQYWRLEAIDSVRISEDDKVPHEQYYKIIDTLISNQEIKNILTERIDDKKTTIYEK
jgi:DNA-binding HxlR family transcriptional regulator